MPIDPCCTIQEALLAIQQLASSPEHQLESQWDLDKFFGCCKIINLPQDRDRLETITKDLQRVGLATFEVFPACDGKKLPPNLWSKMHSYWAPHDLSTQQGLLDLENQQRNESGCYMSHYLLLKEVKEKFEAALISYNQIKSSGSKEDIDEAAQQVKKYSSVLVMEDDNGFGFVNPDHLTASTQGCGLFLRFALAELPEHWDMLYFMALSKKPSQRTGICLRRINGTICTNAYAVKHHMYSDLIQHLQKIEDPAVEVVQPIDNTLSELHAAHHCFAITPSLAYQRPGISRMTSKGRLTLSQLQLKDR